MSPKIRSFWSKLASPIGICASVVAIVGALYAGATWAYATIGAPADVLKPRIVALESQTNNYLSKADFKESQQIYWSTRKSDADDHNSIAIAIEHINTSLADIKDSQSLMRDDIKSLRK